MNFLSAAIAAVLFQVGCPEEKEEEEAGCPADFEIASKVMSEFMGTYFLVLTVGLSFIGGSKAPVFSIAASLMCIFFAPGTCSGAHVNPAVFIALLAYCTV